MAFSPVAQLDIQLGRGDGKGNYFARSAKKCFAPALNISREGGGIFFFKFSRKLAIFGTL